MALQINYIYEMKDYFRNNHNVNATLYDSKYKDALSVINHFYKELAKRLNLSRAIQFYSENLFIVVTVDSFDEIDHGILTLTIRPNNSYTDRRTFEIKTDLKTVKSSLKEFYQNETITYDEFKTLFNTVK